MERDAMRQQQPKNKKNKKRKDVGTTLTSACKGSFLLIAKIISTSFHSPHSLFLLSSRFSQLVVAPVLRCFCLFVLFHTPFLLRVGGGPFQNSICVTSNKAEPTRKRTEGGQSHYQEKEMGQTCSREGPTTVASPTGTRKGKKKALSPHQSEKQVQGEDVDQNNNNHNNNEIIILSDESPASQENRRGLQIPSSAKGSESAINPNSLVLESSTVSPTSQRITSDRKESNGVSEGNPASGDLSPMTGLVNTNEAAVAAGPVLSPLASSAATVNTNEGSPNSRQSLSTATTTASTQPSQKKIPLAKPMHFVSTLQPQSSFSTKLYDRRKDREEKGEFDKPQEVDEYQRVVDMMRSESTVRVLPQHEEVKASTAPPPLMPLSSAPAAQPLATVSSSANAFVSVAPRTNSPTMSFTSASFCNSILEEGGEYTTCALSQYPEPTVVGSSGDGSNNNNANSQSHSAGGVGANNNCDHNEDYDDFLDDMADEDMDAENPLSVRPLGGKVAGKGAPGRKPQLQARGPQKVRHVTHQ